MLRKMRGIAMGAALCLALIASGLSAAQVSIHSCDSPAGWAALSPATVSVVPGAGATKALRVTFAATVAPNPGGGPSPGVLRLRNTNDDPFCSAKATENFGGVRFWVRGDAATKWGNIQFKYGAKYTRAWALFPITPTWTEVTIPWREWFQQNFDGPMDSHYKEMFWIEFTSGFSQTCGHPLSGLPAQAYEIDDIRFVDGITLENTPLPRGNSIQKTVNKMKAKQPVKIVVMGASIAWGLQTAKPALDHWPLKLEGMLRSYFGYADISVINAAVPAFNSFEGACAAGAFIFSQEPVDLVMVADWCYNDFPDCDGQAFGVAQIVKNYEAFFGLVLRRGKSEVMHVQSGLHCEAGKFDLMDATNAGLSALCDSMNIYKADMYGSFKALGQAWLSANYYTIAGDFAHHNAAGHVRGAEIVFESIRNVASPGEAKSVAVKSAGETVVTAPGDGWRALFDGKTTDVLVPQCRENWQVENGVLVARKRTAAQTGFTFSDGQVRLRFELQQTPFFEVSVRQAEVDGYGVAMERAALEPVWGKPQELIFTCRGQDVTALWNGKPIVVSPGGKPASGRVLVNASAGLKIFGIDFRPLP